MMRSGFKRVLLLAVLFFGVSVGNLYAAWWDLNKLPVPPRTEAVNEKDAGLASGSFEVFYYVSALSADEIRDFYLKRLTDAGWQEKRPLDELSRISAPGLLPLASRAVSDCIIFEKGKETVIVRFTTLRNRATREEHKTNYLLSRHQRGEAESPYKDEPLPGIDSEFPPGLLPDYPGATLVGMNEQDGVLYAAYRTSDGVKEAGNFYRENMPAIGWNLRDETPVKSYDLSGIDGGNKKELAAICPQCVKGNKFGEKGEGFTLTHLQYINEEGEECIIAISSLPAFKGEGLQGTLIAVHYRP